MICKSIVRKLPVAGSLQFRGPFFVPLHHLQHALPKLLALHQQGLTLAAPQLRSFSNYTDLQNI